MDHGIGGPAIAAEGSGQQCAGRRGAGVLGGPGVLQGPRRGQQVGLDPRLDTHQPLGRRPQDVRFEPAPPVDRHPVQGVLNRCDPIRQRVGELFEKGRHTHPGGRASVDGLETQDAWMKPDHDGRR
ncbi:hypothetical protein NQV15_10435 [Aeromicrobium wangtongii]|uniref:Uncharacterized protein n=1 Tax=Aeromicrobium wangtongii TaxID=2969247 RepID=A0ABY5M5J9_9ACTN|nr:hypothetical protein [Aeromicrobium wangtongii]MCD9198237.1 hypothetical protein [Aeromicrobium wangtongii]UUP12273.1 hypothetical protein NQV15_10435 [Aeromicrobium wangtongii]